MAKTLEDLLHDEIDAGEEARNEAALITQNVVKDRLSEAIQKTETIGEAMQLLAQWVEDELIDLTTKRFKDAAKKAIERARLDRG